MNGRMPIPLDSWTRLIVTSHQPHPKWGTAVVGTHTADVAEDKGYPHEQIALARMDEEADLALLVCIAVARHVNTTHTSRTSIC